MEIPEMINNIYIKNLDFFSNKNMKNDSIHNLRIISFF